MAGTCADVSGAGVSGGAAGEEPVPAEVADAEVYPLLYLGTQTSFRQRDTV